MRFAGPPGPGTGARRIAGPRRDRRDRARRPRLAPEPEPRIPQPASVPLEGRGRRRFDTCGVVAALTSKSRSRYRAGVSSSSYVSSRRRVRVPGESGSAEYLRGSPSPSGCSRRSRCTSKLSTGTNAPPESRTPRAGARGVDRPAGLAVTAKTSVGEPGGHSAACTLEAGIPTPGIRDPGVDEHGPTTHSAPARRGRPPGAPPRGRPASCASSPPSASRGACACG